MSTGPGPLELTVMMTIWVSLVVLAPAGLGFAARRGGTARRRAIGGLLGGVGIMIAVLMLRARGLDLSWVDGLALALAVSLLTSGVLWVASAHTGTANAARIAWPMSLVTAVLGASFLVTIF